MTSVLQWESGELSAIESRVIVLISTSSSTVLGLPITGATYSLVLAIDTVKI